MNLLNDPVFFEAAQALAARILREAPGSDEGRIQHGFLLALSRYPRPNETSRLHQFLLDERSRLKSDPDVAQLHMDDRLNDSSEWVTLASVLLNLDEFINRE